MPVLSTATGRLSSDTKSFSAPLAASVVSYRHFKNAKRTETPQTRRRYVSRLQEHVERFVSALRRMSHLAGGEGTRVRGFLKQLCGGSGLKQFSSIIGRRSMLQHTLDRMQQLVPAERILVVVGANHRKEAE